MSAACQSAGAEAGDALKAELVIRRGLACLDSQVAADLVHDLRAAPHMAGGSKAYLHHVIARPCELELGVEGGHSVNAAFRNAQEVCNTFHGFRRDIAELALHRLKNRDEAVTVLLKTPKYVL